MTHYFITPYAAHLFTSSSVVCQWGTVSVVGITGDGTVSTMDNTIYKLFPLLVLPCLSDLSNISLYVLVQYIPILELTHPLDYLCNINIFELK